MSSRYVQPLLVFSALAAVQLASIHQLWQLQGGTAFVHYAEAMLFLGPWNFLVSKMAVTTTSGGIPFLVIFVAPVVVALGLCLSAHGIRLRFGDAKAGMFVACMAALHVASGLWWGLLHTSWGP
jgi:hypothetical protein